MLWAFDKAGKAGRLDPNEVPDPLLELEITSGVPATPLAETIGTGFSVTSTLTPGELVLVTIASSGRDDSMSGINWLRRRLLQI